MYLEEELTPKTFDPPTAELTDEEILAQTIKDPRQFRSIIDRYESAFLRKARTILGRREEVKDLVVDERTKHLFEQSEWRDYIISYFHRVPATAAKILKLFFLEDQSQLEIAAALGISVAAVKTRLHRAKKEFRDSICRPPIGGADPAEL